MSTIHSIAGESSGGQIGRPADVLRSEGRSVGAGDSQPLADRSATPAVARETGSVGTGGGSRFVDPQRVLGEAESWMQDVEMVDEEDRTEEESYALALWDELRRLRSIGRAAGPSGTEAIVCADITRRQAHGIAKYGTTVAANPLSLRQWLQHAYEESLDQSVYLRRAIAEIDAPNTQVTDAEPSTPANTRAQGPRSV